MPIGNKNFKNETYFSEFLLEFYDNNKQFITSNTLKVRELDYVPSSVNIISNRNVSIKTHIRRYIYNIWLLK